MQVNLKNIKSKKGFTLIELVVVVALIAVLAGIAIPVVGYTMNRTKASAAASDAKLAEESLKEAHVQIISGITDSYNYTSKISDVMTKAGITDIPSNVEISGVKYSLMWNTDDEQCRYVNTAKAMDVQGNRISSSNWTRSVTPTDNATTVISFFG